MHLLSIILTGTTIVDCALYIYLKSVYINIIFDQLFCYTCCIS